VAYFLEPILAAHDRERVEYLCYAELPHPDEVTQRLQSMAAGWRSTVGVADPAVAQQIRADKIDIAIDLAGHTANTRITVFAYKPAPVQMTYLGYPFSTGLETINYRLTDAYADPPGQSEMFYSERLLRLPQTAWCYRPPSATPDVAPPPMQRNGFVTFGSFNNIAKLGAGAVVTWSHILAAMPTARLALKSPGLGDDVTRSRILQMFADNGIGADRLRLIEYDPSLADHLQRYSEIDIALDAFPYCGTTTTCEAMWMGVPVVTLAGKIHVARVGVSLLSNVGLTDLIAPDRDQYVTIACGLAQDAEKLKSLRSTLRQRMRASPLCDEASFTRSFEELLRGAWREWCSSSPRT
jgi:predicted O-linked N-acetylglucosamine transferase (SPINDLY family)